VKILADTCVWSLALRRRSRAALSDAERLLVASLSEAIKDGRIVLIGPIRQEILSGIKDPAQFDKLKSALEAFPDEPLTTAHYEEAARLFNLCRSRGVACGPVDILLCAAAAREHWSILTLDRGLQLCMEVLEHDGPAALSASPQKP
jgi:predicted nucleic acid-binding protein